ncbi:Na(+)-dependent inorganic phosphate cotransporter [Thermoplasmatales archaeon]|nr:Na(+)-dependent inorganic phosphate cotransporter [Thermoplasmatales archaeon]
MQRADSLPVEQSSSYRWVMATVAGILMTTSFISLTAFSIVSSSIAQTIGVGTSTVDAYGVDAFSIGLFVAFFLGHGGLFDTRVKAGVLVAQAFLIIPQFIIPIAGSLAIIVALRFFQGLMIMMLALFSIQLSGWFRPSERARSLAFTLGAITLGSAAGGILSGVFSSMSWQETYYITGVVMLAGAVIYFVFARNAPSQRESIIKAKKVKHQGAWRNPMTWIMGAVQIPVTWTLFSIGGFLPEFSGHLGYSGQQTTDLVIVWGIAGFIAAFIGSFIGDYWSGKGRTNRQIFRSRIRIMAIADALMGIGALLMILIGQFSYYDLMIAVVINAFLMMLPPNYWASTGSVFPLAIMGSAAFGMGLISNSADAIGPLVSSILVPDFGWDGVFLIMVALSIIGIGICFMASRINFPLAPDSQDPELQG